MLFNLDLVKKSGKYPYDSYQIGEGSNAIVCGGHVCWRNAVAFRTPCALTLTSGASDAREQHGLSIEKNVKEAKA